MGAWGPGPFDSDASLDWLADFEEDAAAAIAVAFEEFDACADQIDADAGELAIVVAETVALAHGAGHPALPPRIIATLQGQAATVREAADAAPRLLRVLKRVADPEHSELARLWLVEEGPEERERAAWRAEFEALLRRVESVAAPS